MQVRANRRTKLLMDAGALNWLTALGIGLLIGLERERSKGTGPCRSSAGIRTFAVAAVFGAAAMQLGNMLLVAVAIGSAATLAGLSYWRSTDADPGLTTEITLALTPLLGALAMSDRITAAMLGVVVAAILAAKAVMHRFVRSTLTATEVDNGLVLAIVAVVIWPLLPDSFIGPHNAINPHLLGLVAILVLGIGAIGHIAVRALGPRYGLPVSGLASGFVSSVATIGAMGGSARAEPAKQAAAIAGASLSSVATFIEMSIVLGAVSPTTLRLLAPALLAGGSVIAIYGGIYSWRSLQTVAGPHLAADPAFSLRSAFLMVTALAGILMLTATVQPLLGQTGVVLSAALGGIVDTHAAAMSVAALVAAGKLDTAAAVVPVLAAMSANAAMKISMAFGTGGSRYGLRIAGGVGLSILAAWATAIIVVL